MTSAPTTVDLAAAWGTSPQPWALGQDWTRLPTRQQVVALTIDAGANADAVGSMLATLRAKHVTATFFLTGAWARTYPAKVAAIEADGHVIGNHSDTHAHLPALSAAEVRGQLSRADAAISHQIGRTSRPLFRFPYGDVSAAALTTVNDAGYVAVRWTVDTLGWMGRSGQVPMTADTVITRVLDRLQPGEIVLMHTGSNPDDGSMLDAEALPRLIDALRARGYGFTTLACLTR